MRSLVFVLAVLTASLCHAQTTRESAKATWVMLAHATAASPSPTPQPTPTPQGDECENCDGRGKVGDGVVMVTCPECGGTGKRKVIAAESGKVIDSRRELIIHTRDNCPPCAALKLIYPELRAAGWKITEIYSTGTTPTVEVWSGNKKKTITGFGSREGFQNQLRIDGDR